MWRTFLEAHREFFGSKIGVFSTNFPLFFFGMKHKQVPITWPIFLGAKPPPTNRNPTQLGPGRDWAIGLSVEVTWGLSVEEWQERLRVSWFFFASCFFGGGRGRWCQKWGGVFRQISQSCEKKTWISRGVVKGEICFFRGFPAKFQVPFVTSQQSHIFSQWIRWFQDLFKSSQNGHPKICADRLGSRGRCACICLQSMANFHHHFEKLSARPLFKSTSWVGGDASDVT